MARKKKSGSSRAIWKGAISFGLVHVPVALHAATQQQDIDFDWLDKRTMDPVGYRRINKRTGREIDKDNIVKGVRLDDDDVVVLSDDEIRAAYPKRTRTIAIESFTKATEISFVYAERPYFLVPDDKAERVYVLLREAMAKAQVVGIARFVLHNKEHLAALIPAGPALMLGTLRWADELRSPDGLDLPKAGAGSGGPKPAELKMAQQLIEQMTARWDPTQYHDDFTQAIRALIRKKVKAGDKASIEPFEEAPDLAASNVVDLSELLRKSLGTGGRRGAGKPAAKAAGKTARRPAAKQPAKAAARRKKAA